MSVTFFAGNDGVIELSGARDGITSVYLNAATVSAQLLEPDGTAVAGTSVTMNYDSGSDGDYRGTLDAANVPAEGEYLLAITFDQANYDAYFRIPCIVTQRAG